MQNGQTNSHWVDGSPYAFQMWKQSEPSTLDMSTTQEGYLLHHHLGNKTGVYSTQYFQRHTACHQCIDYIEPHPDPSLHCTAAVMTAEGTTKWMYRKI